jgi:hypothetical protein
MSEYGTWTREREEVARKIARRASPDRPNHDHERSIFGPFVTGLGGVAILAVLFGLIWG